ncbi:MAG: cysteine synthase A [Pseudomonadota bacterium]
MESSQPESQQAGTSEIKTLDATQTWGRGKTYQSVDETIGQTPLVRLGRVMAAAEAKADVLMKLEFFNPLSSVKDRIGVSMIDTLEAHGHLTPGKSVIVEPTSGNTGVGLAFVAAARGYRIILTMPESMSLERRKLFKHLGAELALTPAPEGMGGAIAKAKSLVEDIDDAVMPSQFENPANPRIHELTTAEEIWSDTGGKVDALVVGVGTGGTLTGCGRVLKARNPNLKVFAVEPTDSPILSKGEKGPHKIQGIGAGFVPENLDRSLIDEVITVPNDMAFEASRMLAKVEGIPGGISTGANLAAALTVATRDEFTGQSIVTFAPSSAERYYSSDLFEAADA